MLYYIASVVLFSFLLIQIPISYDRVPSISFEGYYDLATGEHGPDGFEPEKAFNAAFLGPGIVPGAKTDDPASVPGPAPKKPVKKKPAKKPAGKRGTGGASAVRDDFLVTSTRPHVERADAPRFLRISNGSVIGFAGDLWGYASLFGAGYHRYKKVGKEVRYYSPRGELLWTRDWQSYPVSDPSGKLILLLTGDNNRVDLMDRNGNPVGVREVSGNFLADFEFAARVPAVALAFGSGELYVIGEQGDILLKYVHEAAARPLFFKSTALGPSGKVVAVHFIEGAKDYIYVLSVGSKADSYSIRAKVELASVYPHPLHFAVNEHGLIVTAPDGTTFYDEDGDRIRHTAHTSTIYRPVFADERVFAYGVDNHMLVLDRAGNVLFSLDQARPERELSPWTWRVTGSTRPDEIVIRTAGSLRFIRILWPEE